MGGKDQGKGRNRLDFIRRNSTCEAPWDRRPKGAAMGGWSRVYPAPRDRANHRRPPAVSREMVASGAAGCSKRAPYLHPGPSARGPDPRDRPWTTQPSGWVQVHPAGTARGEGRGRGGRPDCWDGPENGRPAQAASPVTGVSGQHCVLYIHRTGTGSPRHRRYVWAGGRQHYVLGKALLGHSEGRAKVERWRRGWGFCGGKKPEMPGLGCNAARTTAGRRGSKGPEVGETNPAAAVTMEKRPMSRRKAAENAGGPGGPGDPEG